MHSPIPELSVKNEGSDESFISSGSLYQPSFGTPIGLPHSPFLSFGMYLRKEGV